MKKYEYLSELEKRLSALPADARRDALNYYEEYFDAAGPRPTRTPPPLSWATLPRPPQDSGRGGLTPGRPTLPHPRANAAVLCRPLPRSRPPPAHSPPGPKSTVPGQKPCG